MQHDFLDRYSRLNSPIHCIRAGWKLLAALLLLLGIITAPRGWYPPLILTGVLLLAIAAISRIPPRFLLRRLLFLEPFVLGVAVLAIFQPNGWHIFATVVTKSTLCLFLMILLSNTTPFSQLLRVLRRIHVPGLLVTTLALMYRYIFVLVDEAHRMRRARQSRTFTSSRRHAWKSAASLIGQLFVRSTERAERIYSAMCARGWQ